jgi:hypothetical protein
MEQFYKEVYGGTALEGAQLTEFLARAEDQLRLFEQVFTVTEFVENGRKLALCAMAEALSYFEAAQNGTGGLRYASVGTVSVSGKGIYQSMDISPAAQAKELYRCASTYLNIYRGV